jgi:hypothetical protein
MAEIKVTGTPLTYGDGATRNTKEGKGRFDLIPPEPMEFIINRLDDIGSSINDKTNPYMNDEFDVYRRAMRIHNSFGILENEIDNIADVIISLIMYKSGYAECYVSHKLLYDNCSKEFFKTMKELAVHFENGAKIYGEHNCEKGIPKWSFIDSGLRHLTQFLNGEDDENHYIAAIWNLWMLMWTVIKEKSEEDYDQPDTQYLTELKDRIEKYKNEVHIVPLSMNDESEGDEDE